MDTAARARLDRYKQSLLDPTDRLLDIADAGIPIASDPVRIAFTLGSGTPVSVAGDLAAFARDARVASLGGEHVLWLALGLLAYNGGERTAPLVLWPVDIAAGKLVSAGKPRVNDMLLEALRREHDLVIDVTADLDIAALLDRITGFAMTREGWRVELACRLATFSFAAFDLWRDLESLSDVTPPASWLIGDEAAPTTLPAMQSELLTPLDADAVQLAAVSHAASGASFVLQGAPGTGKSQTIANLLVQCATQGKTVLVVSDRVTALDVVAQRLASAGINELCLPLYSTHADRERVLAGLTRVLDRAFRPGSVGPSMADQRLGELRAALDGYATAMHKVGPLGMSIHEVIGRLVELRTAPCAALAERDAAALDRGKYARREVAVMNLALAAADVEPIAAHPWRASTLTQWTEDGTERATRSLNDLASAVETLTSAIADVSALIPNVVARTPEQIRALGVLAELASASPRPGAELLANIRGRNDEIGERIALIRARGGGTIEVPRAPASFLAIATRHRVLANEVKEYFTDSIEDLDDATEVWSQLKRWTGSMAPLRFMALRHARAAVRAAAQPTQLESDQAMLSALEALIAERACRQALLGAAEPARRWFGDLGGDALSLDLYKIEEAVAWSHDLRRAFDQLTISGGESAKQSAWRALVAQVAASPGSGERPAVELAPFGRLAAAVTRWEPAIADVVATTGVPRIVLGMGSDHLAALRDQVETFRREVTSLAAWTRFHLARHAAVIEGIGPAITAIERGDIAASELAAAWQRATLLAWVELELAETREVATFMGSRHHANVSAFVDLDRGSLALVRARAVARISERLPRGKDPNPEIAILRDEARAAHGRALRDVFADLPTLLPRLAPCILATPHAVAQHLGKATFDVVVFDEASRIPAAHALGAIARGKAIVVAGDCQQAEVSDNLLELALDAKLPTLTLGTHYRARHEDVFAFANKTYYGDKIEVLPAPARSSDLGIAWRRVEGSPDAAGANLAEAEAIVAELKKRATRSTMVVALSRAQEELISKLVEADDVLAPLLTAEEPLLIGTPDRLQGEERDITFLSIGDSADALGALAHAGGHRWLDVAITRARDQLVVVSSFDPEAIADDAAPSARQLAELLAFARAGGGASKPALDAQPASPVTAAIARALSERGWQLVHQVGCGAYKLDLAVVDPNDPERYVLAIEHDGAAYASSTTARSRDRLRAAQLAQLGWKLHRVWSLDWWLDPERESQRAHGAIVAAIAASRQKRISITPPMRRVRASSSPVLAAGSAPLVQPNAEITARLAAPELDSLRGASKHDTTPVHADTTRPIAAPGATPGSGPLLAAGSGPTDAAVAPLPSGYASAPARIPRGAIGIGPYVAAAVPAGRRAPDDMFAPRYLAELGKCIEQVLAAEAPIHIDLLARRCAAYFGIGKITPRVIEQIRSALLGRGKLGPEKDIVWRADQDPATMPPVRVAGNTATARRDIAEVPLSEVAAAARIVVERANGMAASDLVRDCARLLGFARITDQVSERVALGIRLAAARELISIDSGKAHLLLDG